MDTFLDDFHHSEPIDTDEVTRVCTTFLPVRRTKYSEEVDEATQRFQQDWVARVGFPFNGGRSSKGHFAAICNPETSIIRLKALTEIYEFYFGHDDSITSTTVEEAKYDEESLVTSKLWGSAQQQIHSRILLNLLQIDKQRGQMLVKALSKFSKVHGTRKFEEFDSFNDLMQYRWIDAGSGFLLTMLIFGGELDLSQADIDAVLPISWPALAAATLVNDLYSFDKEVDQDLPSQGYLMSGVWYLMQSLNMTISEAKHALLHDKILPLEKQYLERKNEYLQQHQDASLDMRRFLDAVGYMAGGNTYWSVYADRYCKWRDMPNLAHQVLSHSSSDLDETQATCASLLAGVKQNGQHTPNGLKPPTKPSDQELDDSIIRAPIEYLRRVPSKNIRGSIVRALNTWLNVPDEKATLVDRITSHLHEASLLLDDIEDNSSLRRGQPVTHHAFGQPQTINAANYLIVGAFQKFLLLGNPKASPDFILELQKIHVGQSRDLHWSHSCYCPSVTEYFEMIKQKTGGLFRLLGHLLYDERTTTKPIEKDDVSELMTLLGQYFQVRDDFINLTSADYHTQKGFAEDLDGGKYTLPLIHLLNHYPHRSVLDSILHERLRAGRMSNEMKQFLIEEMKRTKSLESTQDVLHDIGESVQKQLCKLERQTGETNYIFRFLLVRLMDG